MRLATAAWLSIAISAAAACGESESAGSGGGPASGGAEGGAPGVGGSAGTGPASGGTASGAGGTSSSSSSAQQSSSSSRMLGCADQPNLWSCTQCFNTMNPGGLEAYRSVVVLLCGCTPGALCHQWCDTMGPDDVCPSPGVVDVDNPFNPICTTCINDALMTANPCLRDFDLECQADPDCASYVADIATCPPV